MPEFRLVGAPTIEAGAAVAGFGEPGSWLNNIVNLGMHGPVAREDMDAVTGWYVERGIEPRIELCPYAHASVTRHAADLGYVLNPGGAGARGEGTPVAFETVLYRTLPAHPERVHTPRTLSPDITISVVDPRDDERVREFTEVSLRGFFPPGLEPSDGDRQAIRATINHRRTIAVAAMHEGRIVGTSAMEVSGEVCALFGATVATEFRRRGIQQALIASRLNTAIERGARVATIGSRPGIPTERNVMRMGFAVAYTKVILVKQGPELKGIVG